MMFIVSGWICAAGKSKPDVEKETFYDVLADDDEDDEGR